MPEPVRGATTSKTSVWAGRIITTLVVLLLVFDGAIKALKLPAAVDGAVQSGYPAGTVLPIGIVLLACVVIYVTPRTSILGAILLTGYLGGATATMVRLSNTLFPIPVVLGMLVWAGLFFRDERLRALIPVRK
jgi:DoxX-like family